MPPGVSKTQGTSFGQHLGRLQVRGNPSEQGDLLDTVVEVYHPEREEGRGITGGEN